MYHVLSQFTTIFNFSDYSSFQMNDCFILARVVSDRLRIKLLFRYLLENVSQSKEEKIEPDRSKVYTTVYKITNQTTNYFKVVIDMFFGHMNIFGRNQLKIKPFAS